MKLTRTLLTAALLTGLTLPALADHGTNGTDDSTEVRASLTPATGITGSGRAEYATRTVYAQGNVAVAAQKFHIDVAQTYTADPTSTAPSTLTARITTSSAAYTCTLPLASISQNLGRNGGRKGSTSTSTSTSSAWVAKYELSILSADSAAAYAEQSGAYCTSTASTWVVPEVASGDGTLSISSATATLFSGSF